jgi:hypothetical protein
MQYSSLAAQIAPTTTSRRNTAQLSRIHRNVEKVLDGRVFDHEVTSSVESVLFDHAMRHMLVYAARQLAELLRQEGLNVELQYCSCPQHGHPVPFLVARDDAGNFIVPEIFPAHPIFAQAELLIIDCSRPQSQKISKGKSDTNTDLLEFREHEMTFCDTPTVFTRQAANNDRVHFPGAAALVLLPS